MIIYLTNGHQWDNIYLIELLYWTNTTKILAGKKLTYT